MLLPGIFISKQSEVFIRERFKEMQIDKKRGKLRRLAQDLKPVIRGIINYYGKFSTGHLRKVLYQLNVRLLKWVKREKGFNKMKSIH
jgi:hypothetical protein